MRPNTLKQALADAPPVVCGWLSAGDPYLAEVLGHSGYDSVVVDLQHGMFGTDRLAGLLAAISSTPAVPMVRVAANNPEQIGKVLDAGAYGVICPGVDSSVEAAQFVSACRYPPSGMRSFGPSRGLTYGGTNYLEHADDTVLAWAMVESSSAVDRVDDIARTRGLDGIYLGPSDLALSLGVPVSAGPFAGPLLDAVTHVLSRCHKAGRVAGIFCSSRVQVEQVLDMGWDMVTPGNDMSLVRAEAQRRLGWFGR